jgi:hypothetical protein
MCLFTCGVPNTTRALSVLAGHPDPLSSVGILSLLMLGRAVTQEASFAVWATPFVSTIDRLVRSGAVGQKSAA